ncbi:MAG: MBL fold metallo-hydrolase [Solirubrobacterales bacterium]
MNIRVLGKSPAYTDAGGACSGYLVGEGDTNVLLDCGSGVFSKLRQCLDYCALDAVVISHLHADHILDLIPYAYALTYAPRQQPVPVARWEGTDNPARPRLIAPPGAGEVFTTMTELWANPTLIQDAFALEEYDPDEEIEIGPMRVRFAEVPHFTTTYAVEFAHADDPGRRFTYGADCRPSSELVEFARDSPLLFVEATLPRPERGGVRGHMTPGEAGEHAKQAGVERAVLIHISDELDTLWARNEAAAAFSGQVDVASEGAVYEI